MEFRNIDESKHEPKIFRIKDLPLFIQQIAMDIWEENKVDPKDMGHIVFTYFEGIYTSKPMPTDLFVHESVHYVRQGSGQDENRAKEWWLRYASDKEFRYQEELLAYREQYKYILKKTNKAIAFEFAKNSLAKDLSSEIYGNLKSFYACLSDIIKQ